MKFVLKLTAIKSLHDIEYIHQDIHEGNIVFGLVDEPPSGQPRLSDMTYETNFYLIGVYLKNWKYLTLFYNFLSNCIDVDLGKSTKYMENGEHVKLLYDIYPIGRRTDMESLGRVLIGALTRFLPDVKYLNKPNSTAIVVSK